MEGEEGVYIPTRADAKRLIGEFTRSTQNTSSSVLSQRSSTEKRTPRMTNRPRMTSRGSAADCLNCSASIRTDKCYYYRRGLQERTDKLMLSSNLHDISTVVMIKSRVTVPSQHMVSSICRQKRRQF